MVTIAQQLQTARETLAPVAGELAPLEARILAQHAWGVKPEVIVRDAELPVEQDKIATLEVLVARRLTREPIAQILGYKHFWKDDFDWKNETFANWKKRNNWNFTLLKNVFKSRKKLDETNRNMLNYSVEIN